MLEEVAYRVRGAVWLVTELVRLAEQSLAETVRILELRGRERRRRR